MSITRNTLQKQLILEAVGKLDVHATAEQVYDHVALTYPTISKATVYRNLRQLAESGELLSVGSIYGSTHYDHRCHKHSHFVCAHCKQVFDVEGDFSSVVEKARKNKNINVSGFQLIFSGLCNECASKQLST